MICRFSISSYISFSVLAIVAMGQFTFASPGTKPEVRWDVAKEGGIDYTKRAKPSVRRGLPPSMTTADLDKRINEVKKLWRQPGMAAFKKQIEADMRKQEERVDNEKNREDGVQRVFVPNGEIQLTNRWGREATIIATSSFLLVKPMRDMHRGKENLFFVDRDFQVEDFFSRIPKESYCSVLAADGDSILVRVKQKQQLNVATLYRISKEKEIEKIYSARAPEGSSIGIPCTFPYDGGKIVCEQILRIEREPETGKWTGSKYCGNYVFCNEKFDVLRKGKVEWTEKSLGKSACVGSKNEYIVNMVGDGFRFMAKNNLWYEYTTVPAESPWKLPNPPDSGALLGQWGIVPKSRYFAWPRANSNRLPVFDLGGEKPAIVHTFKIGSAAKEQKSAPQQIVSLVWGNRLYVKKDNKNVVTAYDMSKSERKSEASRSLFDVGPFPEDNFIPFAERKYHMLWRRELRCSENEKTAFMYYWNGMLVVAGRANILFVDPDSGRINYRFCTLYEPGNTINPSKEWIRNAKKLRMLNDIYSFAFFGKYLVAASYNSKEPLYIWKLPKALNRRQVAGSVPPAFVTSQ